MSQGQELYRQTWMSLASIFMHLFGIPQSTSIWLVQHPTAIAETTIAETTNIEDKLSEKMTVLEGIKLNVFTGFEDTTALEDKKILTFLSAIAVVGCIVFVQFFWNIFCFCLAFYLFSIASYLYL